MDNLDQRISEKSAELDNALQELVDTANVRDVGTEKPQILNIDNLDNAFRKAKKAALELELLLMEKFPDKYHDLESLKAAYKDRLDSLDG